MKKVASVDSRIIANGYKALVKKIVREYEALEALVKNSVARGQWKVGKYIFEHLLGHKDKPGYATDFYEQLAKDTGRDVSTLQRSVRFYRAYPNSAPGPNLGWGHYRGLLTVRDPEERRKLENEIIKKKWDTHQLQKYLNIKRRLAAVQKDGLVPQLKFTRGKLRTYRVVPANKTLAPRGPLALDLGFREQYDIPQDAPQLKENDTVELVSASGRKDGELSVARKVSVAKEELFTYKACVEKVIDGDTLLVSFDFQCPMSVSQKLRLRGINCPEMDTEEGKRAKRFVESRLKDCAFIIVKTYKDRTDKFDRYLADIFYAPQLPQSREAASTPRAQAGRAGVTLDFSGPSFVAREGKYLNQELLNERLAVAYE